MYSIMIHEQNKSMCCRMLYSRADFMAGAFEDSSVRLKTVRYWSFF